MKRERIETYDAWRGIAALMILFSHMAYLSAAINPFWLWFHQHFMRYGALVTSFFFLCSGYFLCYTWKKQAFGGYIKGKLKRIYPLTLLVFLLALLVDLLFSGNSIVNANVKAGSAQWFFNIFANLLLFKPFIPVESTYYSFHGPSWYIAVLFWFYVVSYPVLKRLRSDSESIRDKAARVTVGVVLAAYVLELLVCILTRVFQWQPRFPCYVNPLFRIFGEGFAGILLCVYQEPIQRKLKSLLGRLRMSDTALELSAVALFLLDIFLRYYVNTYLYYSWLQIIPMGFILIAFRRQAGAVSKALRARPFQFLGEISFELYMTHAFVYEGLPIAVGFVSASMKSWLISHAGTRFCITLVLCILVGWIVHVLLDRFTKRFLLKKQPG